MYGNDKILALIPARSGSKGIKNKNIINLDGKPLIAFTIEAAKDSKYIDKIVVSTDGKEIAKVALEYGADVPFMRPAEIAEDTSKTIDAVLHAINTLEAMGDYYDVLVLLQPTQPLRTSDDIDKSIDIFYKYNQRGLASVKKVDDHPILIRSISEEGILENLLDVSSTCRRQDMPEYYKVDGAIYINKVSELSPDTSFNDNSVPFLIEKSHSVDVDDLEDVLLAYMYLHYREKRY